MPLEYEIPEGARVWIKNPVTGVISYVVDVRGKSFAFTLGGRSELDPAAPTLSADEIAHAQAACPFCPGNEAMAPVEILRVTPAGFPQWKGDGTARGAGGNPWGPPRRLPAMEGRWHSEWRRRGGAVGDARVQQSLPAPPSRAHRWTQRVVHRGRRPAPLLDPPSARRRRSD